MFQAIVGDLGDPEFPDQGRELDLEPEHLSREDGAGLIAPGVPHFHLWRREAAEVGGIGEKGPGVGGGDGEALGLVEFVEFHGGDTLVMDGAKRCLR